jgi:hypothetical protein
MPLHLIIFMTLLIAFALYDVTMIIKIVRRHYSQFISSRNKINFYIQLIGDVLLIYTITHILIISV